MQTFKEHIRAENTVFHVAVALAALALCVLGFVIIREYRTLPDLTKTTLNIASVTQNLRYYEEKRTTAIAAASGIGDKDGRFKKQYTENTQKLLLALKDAATLEQFFTGSTQVTDRITRSNRVVTQRHLAMLHQLQSGTAPNAGALVPDNNYVDEYYEYNRWIRVLLESFYDQIRENMAAVESASAFKVVLFAVYMLLTLFTYIAAVSLLKRSRRRLLAEHRLLGHIVDHMPVAFYAKTVSREEDNYIRFNVKAEQLLGRFRNDVLQRGDADIFSVETAERLAVGDRQALDGDVPVINEKEPIDAPNGAFNAHIIRVPIHETDAPATVITFIRDTAARKDDVKAHPAPQDNDAKKGRL